MKKLFYVPIIPTSKDLGKKDVPDLDREAWCLYIETIESFWDSISDYFDSIDVSGMKIYQDGMLEEGKAAQKILAEGIETGNRNYELVLKFLERKAILVKAEDFKLVKEESDMLFAIKQTKSIIQKLVAFSKYVLAKNSLLNKKAEFIAKRIDETLSHGENGIIFIRPHYKIKKKLSEDIQIIEVKHPEKVKEYQSLLPFYFRHQRRFVELSRYLASEISDTV